MIGIISLVVKATVVMACAFAAAAVARRARASMRHGVFAALFIALLLLPVASWLMPATEVAVPVELAIVAGEGEGASGLGPRASGLSGEDDRGRAIDWVAAARNVYLAGVVFFLASLAAGVWRLRRWADDAEIWLEGTTIAAGVAHANQIRRVVLVVISDDVAVPLTFGFRRQTVVMPASSKKWTMESVRRAIRHELEHVRRDDWAMQLMARVACAVWWPHPLAWIALRRFCVEAERACDDAVVKTSEAPGYAEQLVTLARTIDRPPAVPALAMASHSRLSERVRAILDPRQPRGPQGRATLLLTAGIMVAILVTFGPVRLVAAAVSDAIEDGVREGVAGAFEDEDEDDWYRESVVRAAEKGDIRALEFFERQGIDLNEAIIGDGTPLLIAARRGRIEAVRWLLGRGVDPNVPSPGDGNALIAAAGAGQTNIMEILLDRGARIEDVVPGDENALITAAAEGSDQAVKLLIRRGANVNARVWADDREWRTPLNMARRNGHRDIVRILMNAGAQE